MRTSSGNMGVWPGFAHIPEITILPWTLLSGLFSSVIGAAGGGMSAGASAKGKCRYPFSAAENK